jgi:hypothetical protein
MGVIFETGLERPQLEGKQVEIKHKTAQTKTLIRHRYNISELCLNEDRT